jgi:hypothetical protein
MKPNSFKCHSDFILLILLKLHYFYKPVRIDEDCAVAGMSRGDCALLGFLVDCVWDVMAHAQKPDFVFQRNGRVHLNRWGRQFSRLLAAEVCASAVVMLDTPCSEVVWEVLATHSIRQFPLHFPSRASPCAITFQLDSTSLWRCVLNKVISCAPFWNVDISTLYDETTVSPRNIGQQLPFGAVPHSGRRVSPDYTLAKA